MKLIIAGSREITDINTVIEALRHFKFASNKITEIISGGAPGVDTLAIEIAKRYSIQCRIFDAPWDMIDGKPDQEIGVRYNGERYWKKAGFYRNRLMAHYGDRLLAVWNSKSPGTRHMIKTMEEFKKPVSIYKKVL